MLKRCDFRARRKEGCESISLMLTGRLFQMSGPQTEKARQPNWVLVRRTTADLVVVDRSWRRWGPLTLNVTRSLRYGGERLWRYSCLIYLHAGFRPRLACQFWSHVSSFFALLLSPCWPMICRMFVGLYLSTQSKDSDAVSQTAETSGLCVSCVVWLSCVCGVVVAALPCRRLFTLLHDNGVTTWGEVSATYSSTHINISITILGLHNLYVISAP